RLLPRRPGDDLDSGRSEVRRIGQRQLGEATAEQLLEPSLERRLERRERRAELGGDHQVQLADQLPRTGDGRPQVRALGLERLEPGLELGVLLDGIWVRCAELVEAAAELPEAARRGHV